MVICWWWWPIYASFSQYELNDIILNNATVRHWPHNAAVCTANTRHAYMNKLNCERTGVFHNWYIFYLQLMLIVAGCFEAATANTFWLSPSVRYPHKITARARAHGASGVNSMHATCICGINQPFAAEGTIVSVSCMHFFVVFIASPPSLFSQARD